MYFKVSDDELVLYINLPVQYTHTDSSLTVIFSFQMCHLTGRRTTQPTDKSTGRITRRCTNAALDGLNSTARPVVCTVSVTQCSTLPTLFKRGFPLMQGCFLRGRISPSDSVENQSFRPHPPTGTDPLNESFLLSGTGQLRLRGTPLADLGADVISQGRAHGARVVARDMFG